MSINNTEPIVKIFQNLMGINKYLCIGMLYTITFTSAWLRHRWTELSQYLTTTALQPGPARPSLS